MLGPAGARRAFALVRARMGRNGALVEKLIDLLDGEGRANLGVVLAALYPGVDKDRAQASLRQLRLEIGKAAEKAPAIAFALEGDTKTRSEPEERAVWFAGDDGAEFAGADVSRIDPVWIPMDAMKQGPVSCVVVYAAADRAEAEKLLGELDPHFRRAEIVVWRETEILAGEKRAEEWARACGRADLGLLLVSPAFEVDAEARAAVARLTALGTRTVPVQLHETVERHPLEVFRDAKGRAFDGCGKKRDFALALFRQIQARLAQEPAVTAVGRELDFVEGDAALVSLEREPGSEGVSTGVRGGVLDYLRKWATGADEPPICALLGELGMGKTTTVRELARQFQEERAAGGTVPLPMLVDLRFLGGLTEGIPDLDTILERATRLGWAQGRSAAEIRERVAQGALLIFDGLDEVLVHLTPAQGQMFTQQLFRALPREKPKGKLLITCRTHYFRDVKHECGHFTAQDRDHVKAANYRGLVLLPFTEEQIRRYLVESLGETDGERALALIQTVHNLPELAERPYTLSLIRRQFRRLEEWKAEGRRVTGVTLYRFFVDEWLGRDAGKHRFLPEHKQRLMEHVAAELVRGKRRSWTAEELEEWLLDYLDANPRVRRRYVPEGAAGITQQELLMEDLRTATFLVREGDQFRFAHTSLQEFFLAGYLRRALEERFFEGWALAGVSRETLGFLGQSLEERPSAAALEGLGVLRDGYRALASELGFRYFVLARLAGYPAVSGRGFQLAGADLWEFSLDFQGRERLDLGGIVLRGADLGNSFWRGCDLRGGDFVGVKGVRSLWVDCELGETDWAGADLVAAGFRRCGLEGAKLEGGWRVPGVLGEREREVAVQVGHSGSVNACAWSPDGRRVVSGSDDGTLKVWDAESGRCLLTLRGHEGAVNGCAWSPDGGRVVSASDDASVRVWEANSGSCLLILRGLQNWARACAWSPDGRRVLSASDDNSLRIWDSQSGQCLLTLQGHREPVLACDWSADGLFVISASMDGTLKLWDPNSGRCLLTLLGHENGVGACRFSPNGRRILSASWDGTLKTWEVKSGQCLTTVRSQAEWNATCCAWSPDGALAVAASLDGGLKLWDAKSVRCLVTLTGHAQLVTACAWSSNGQRVLSASTDRTLKIWDATSGRCLLTFEGHQGFVSASDWSTDGSRVMSAATEGPIQLWDFVSSRRLAKLIGHEDVVADCKWRPDGRQVLSASHDRTLRLWDSDSGDCLLTLRGHEDSVTGCGWSPDGRRVVSGSTDNTVKVWDADSGRCVFTLAGHSRRVVKCAWSPDGDRVLSASWDKTLKVWDARSTNCLLTVHAHKHPIYDCAWRPDGKRFVSASGDHTMSVWDAESGDRRVTFRGHRRGVTACAWTLDGRRVVSASYDRTLRLWNAESGECLLVRRLVGFGTGLAVRGRQVLVGTSVGLSIFELDTLEETGFQLYNLEPPHGGPTWAMVDVTGNRVLDAGPGAWESLGWIVRESGAPEWVPAEAFGEELGD